MQVLGLVILLGVGLVVFVVALIAYTVHSLTHPPRRATAWALARSLPSDPSELPVPPGSPPVEHTSWAFRAVGVELPVWEIRGSRPEGPTIVVTHGWGDSRVVSLQRAPVLLGECSRLVLWDLPGHADAGGACSLGPRESEALRELVGILGRDSALVLMGHSLGAAVTLHASSMLEVPPACVVAEAPYVHPYTPASNVMRLARLPGCISLPASMALLGWRADRTLTWARPGRPATFDSARAASRLTCPVLVIAGAQDPITPIEDAREIAARARNATLVELPDARHTDFWEAPNAQRTADAVVRFIRTHAGVENPAGV